jgi:LuxR family transcriptional regulator, activator of conjugal transfer of Ti plasmids
MSMRALFGEIIDAALSASSEDTLTGRIADTGRQYGFDNFAYLSLHTASARSFAISTYAPEWQSVYFLRSYMVIDPVVTMGKRMMRAFQWSSTRSRKMAGKDERGFWDLSAAFGLRTGLTVPIRTGMGQVAMLTFASDMERQFETFTEADNCLASTAVAYIHMRLGNSAQPTTLRKPGLTEREALCMRWAAAGMSMHDIALTSGLNYHTVRWDLDNVRSKLGAKNLKEALAVAAALHLF